MNNQRQEMDMGFTKEVIPECHHLCLIYDSEEERQKIVSEYLAAGLKRGEIVRYFADTCLLYTSPSPRDRTRSRMPSSA